MSALTHRLDRTIIINAPRESVFRYFTDSPLWASWWGAGSTIDSRPGGKIHIRYPEGTVVAGDVVEVRPSERIVFTYGYVSGDPIPPESSRVTIQLAGVRGATRLTLTHEFDSAAVRDQHVQGWRYQLSVFANVVTDHLNRGASAVIDAWFDAWAEPDAAVREMALAHIAAPDGRFHDRYSNIDGLTELFPHIAATQHFMPGLRMKRSGDIRHCQGTVLADYAVVGADGNERARGTNVFVFGPTGQIESSTGFMNPAKSA
ncbi:MAG TPA: SRPBCC domain-containing protein [Gemmatimonadaceae bacterium]